jgi:hypothetical protein
VFWNSSGISADFGLSGLHLHAESLESLLTGGVAFATPDSSGHAVKAGSVFKLHPEFKEKWLAWDPPLTRATTTGRHTSESASSESTVAKQSDAIGEAKGEAKKDDDSPGFFARFFHHDGKNEETAKQDAEEYTDAAHQDAHHEKKHRLLGGRHQ